MCRQLSQCDIVRISSNISCNKELNDNKKKVDNYHYVSNVDDDDNDNA